LFRQEARIRQSIEASTLEKAIFITCNLSTVFGFHTEGLKLPIDAATVFMLAAAKLNETEIAQMK